MRVLAGLCSGVAVYLLVAYLTGHGPTVRLRSSPTAQVTQRQLWLIQAGTDLTPRQFRAGSAAAGMVAFAVFLAFTGAWWIALVPGTGVFLWPRAHYARRRANRLAALPRSWPDGLRDVVAHVKSGATLSTAIEDLALRGPEALRMAFARFPVQARMLGVVPALEIVKEELADPTSDKVIEVLILAHHHGGDLIEDVLRDLIETTSADLATLETIRTADFEQKLESWVIVAAPWVLLVFLATIPEAYVRFYQSSAGRFVVLFGAIWAAAGFLMMRWIAKQREEPRVLGGAAAVSEANPRLAAR